MSKVKVVETVEQDGNNYGQISHPRDLVQAQQYAHEHTEQITKDFLTQAEAEVAGCVLTLATGLTANVAAGRIYRSSLQYESQDTTLTLPAAHEEFDRIDLIVAVLTANAPTNLEFLAFQRLRTEQELNDAEPAYPPTQFQRFTERHNVAAIIVKSGIPSDAPQPPALAAGEVTLFDILLPANGVTLALPDIIDRRKIATNLRALNTQVVSMLASIKELEKKVEVLKYRFPTLVTGDGRCPATTHLDGTTGNYVIDIPVGTLVEFGDRFVAIEDDSADDMTTSRATSSTAPIITYGPIFEGEIINIHNAVVSTTSGNVIRINAPATQKWLYLSYDGRLFFRSSGLPSNGNQCLLMRITPVSGGAPILKRYRNLRESITGYTKTVVTGDASTKQFELDTALPDGYIYADAFAVRASDKLRYSILVPYCAFDSIVTVTGVADGDTWIVNITALSAL